MELQKPKMSGPEGGAWGRGLRAGPEGGARLKVPNSSGVAKQIPLVSQGGGARCQSTEEAELKHKLISYRFVFCYH